MSGLTKSNISKFLNTIDKGLSHIESSVLILILSSVVFLAFFQIILRNFFSYSIIWGDPLLRHMVLWIAFLGASLANKENRHINIDVLHRLMGPVGKKRVSFITNLFSALVSGLLVRAAFVFVRDEFTTGTTLFPGVPLWPMVSIILIGFISITFRFILKAFFPVKSSHSFSGAK